MKAVTFIHQLRGHSSTMDYDGPSHARSLTQGRWKDFRRGAGGGGVSFLCSNTGGAKPMGGYGRRVSPLPRGDFCLN